MGMESYDILVMAKNIKIIKRDNCWNLEGESEYHIRKLDKVLSNMKMEKINDSEWEFDKCLELKILSKNGYLQGIEIRGCISYLEEGIASCYDIIRNINQQVMSMDIYILNEKIKVKNVTELYQYICDRYQEKIDIFNKQYNNLRLKVTCGKFYNEMQRRNKWYYKFYKKLAK